MTTITKPSRLTAGQRRFASIGIAPILVYVLGFGILSFVWAVAMSFFAYTPTRQGSGLLGLGGANPFVGLGNYRELLWGVTKPAKVFRLAVGNTFLFTVLALPLNLMITLPLAVMLESVRERMRTLFRAIYFLPTITSSVAVYLVWRELYADNWGLISAAMKLIGLTPPKSFLFDSQAVYMGVPLAMIACVIAHVWQDFGYNLVIFIAALQGIPKSIREAARMDGANALQEFRYVVVPLLSRTLLFTCVLTVLSSLQVFVIFQLLTRGGPNNQTQTMLLSIYQNAFVFANNLGMAGAMSMVLFMIILILTVVQFRMLRTQWEY